jgi:AcrR family transcriptional regulator
MATRSFRGVSAEQRRAERRERLLEAALDLIGEGGWGSATMTAICNRARLTERYFYESFADREQLYLALMDELAEETALLVLGAVDEAPDDLAAKVRAAFGAFVELLATDRRKAHVALLDVVGSEAVQRRRREIVRDFAHLMAERARVELGDAAPDERELELTSLVLVSGLGEVVVTWLDGTLDTTTDELVERATELTLRAVQPS